MSTPHNKNRKRKYNYAVMLMNNQPILYKKQLAPGQKSHTDTFGYHASSDDEYIEVPADSESIIYNGDDGAYEISIDDLLEYDDDNEIQYTKSNRQNAQKQYMTSQQKHINVLLANRASRMMHLR